ncbi:chaperone modulator CbpM [Neptunitalea lumnitzerae]|uniref:MerR family transcriptional regulator n=1 Tax=Neptunitalea lumnitzerae TaxID=2965509 RepID=A0ABQ5MFP2_9FLAO|nr:chaperone modulator CbpM [Neptunitalea sp. Y10]GLB48198.1 hypothetical protein Y10_05660 [Neptunitalea sp. Y10]
MKTEQLISVTTFCKSHCIEPTFIHSLAKYDFVEIIINKNNEAFIAEKHLQDVERMMRLHYDLNINMEGIDAIQHLLKQIDSLQKEVITLRNKLHA